MRNGINDPDEKPVLPPQGDMLDGSPAPEREAAAREPCWDRMPPERDPYSHAQKLRHADARTAPRLRPAAR